MTRIQLPAPVEAALRGHSSTSRRDFLKTSGVIVVTVGAAVTGADRLAATGSDGAAAVPAGDAGAGSQAAGPYPDPDFRQLDTWIAIHDDNTATFFVGKTDCGQGTGTAFRQIMSDELDMPYESTDVVMGSTDVTPDQGGSGGSDALQRDGWPMRRVAAEARRVLVELGAERLGVGVDEVEAADGSIRLAADPSRAVTYARLVAGRRFDVTLTGRNVNEVTGVARVKAVQDLHMVGQSPPRYDIPPKVDGSLTWAVDMTLPGMVHARNLKPPVAGATLRSVDESSVEGLPGFVAIVRRGNYLAVVCEREEQAVDAARRLRAEWDPPATAPFPDSADLFTFMRRATPVSSSEPTIVGDPDAALRDAATVVEADYDVPFQGHTAFGPAHALADPSDGQMTIYTNDMKSYGMRNGVAEFLGMPRDRVRVVWMEGPQAYGRTAADDAGFEAAFLANELQRPVRVQWMRDEETAWDTKAPAFTVGLRGGLDSRGQLAALEFDARSLDYNHVGYNEVETVLISQLMGTRKEPNRGRAATPSEMYVVPNRRTTTHVVSLPMIWETPLRTGNLRDPNGPQVTFAAESFIDELAAAANADPLQFRLDMLTDSSGDDEGFRRARSVAVIRAAAERYGWDSRPSPTPRDAAQVLTGRGIAYSFRSQTIVAQIAEVEIDRATGHVWVKRLVCAHDCGLVINPVALRAAVECGMLHSLSRALHEEVQFDTEKVTSTNWRTHPSLTHADMPEAIDIVLVNGDPDPDRPDLPHYGAGEAVCKPLLAAVGNAIFDATGVRLRRVPFSDERVRAALIEAGSVG